MPIDPAQVRVLPGRDEDREFSYYVKVAAEGDYIAQVFEWDDELQRAFHERSWTDWRPSVIWFGDVRIGTIAVRRRQGAIEVGQFFILPEYQRRGIGSHLLRGILDGADAGGETVRLAYLRGNPVGTLYERHGFRTVRQDESFVHMERPPLGERAGR